MEKQTSTRKSKQVGKTHTFDQPNVMNWSVSEVKRVGAIEAYFIPRGASLFSCDHTGKDGEHFRV